MTLAERLRSLGDLPFEEALPKQVEVLQNSTLVLPVAENLDDQATETEFLMGKDAEGRSWLYAYTSDERMTEAGIADAERAQFRFEDLVDIAHRNGLGGIVIDVHDVDVVVHIPNDCLASLNTHLNG